VSKGFDFDFENFSVAMIKAIDEIRSFGSSESTEPRESRVGALYRAIGLPSARPHEDRDIDKRNNGNYFDNINLSESDQALINSRELSFTQPIEDDETGLFLSFNISGIDAGVLEGPRKRKRGGLFPMYASSDYNILPQEKRVAGAFMTDDEREVGNNMYRRPLIEAIILIRLKGGNVQNSELQDILYDNFNISGDDNISLKRTASVFGDNLNIAIESSIDSIKGAIKQLGEVRKKDDSIIIPEIGAIVEANYKLKVSENETGEINSNKKLSDVRDNVKKSILTLLEYDDTYSSNKEITKNIRDTILMSQLLTAVKQAETSFTEKQKRSDAFKKSKTTGVIKSIFRTLELATGTFGGISGIDIMVILLALFSIEEKALMGLVNEEARDRLFAQREVKPAAGDVTESVTKLQETVIEIYKIISERYVSKDQTGKR